MGALAARWRAAGARVGFVPTMGALHAGHRSLIQAARAECDRVVVSVFVNPRQFGPDEDLDRYPRTLDADLRLAGEAGADAAFVPKVEAVYPPGFATTVSVSGLTEGLCGASRPGHFDGVATVVARLFGIVGPCRAYFGQKDYQQVAVVRRMVADLALPVAVVSCPIVREPDGLAMSSRNRYLDADTRRRAAAVPRALEAGAARVAAGEHDPERVLGVMRALLEAAGGRVDYVAAVNAETLRAVARVGMGDVLLVAVRFGGTRLIDNRVLS
ncbi:MAG: pantoate--beta-alanine ligase [Nitrospirae bacterium]|nr:pantoate--beta-alanine ligase [Nitrospirota bacterium]